MLPSCKAGFNWAYKKSGLKWVIGLIVIINQWREVKATWCMARLFDAFSKKWPSGWQWFRRHFLQKNWRNFPNLLSFLRIALTWPLVNCIGPENFLMVSFYLFLICLTDLIDGAIARAADCQTQCGKFIDPLADKIFILSVMAVQHNYHPMLVWGIILAIIFGEDFSTLFRIYKWVKSIDIASNNFGQIKLWLQVSIVILIFFKIKISLTSQVGLNALLIFSGILIYYNITAGIRQAILVYKNTPETG